jgi:hypothetical protein
LEQWLRPEFALSKGGVDFLSDCGVGDVDETLNIAGVIVDDFGVRLENIHCVSVLPGFVLDAKPTIPVDRWIASYCQVTAQTRFSSPKVSALVLRLMIRALDAAGKVSKRTG